LMLQYSILRKFKTIIIIKLNKVIDVQILAVFFILVYLKEVILMNIQIFTIY
jgi:hypothetical protein